MKRRILPLSILFALLVSAPLVAAQGKVVTSIESGERSLTDVLEDRDTSAIFDFVRYNLRIDENLSSATHFDAAYEHYFKDYSALDTFDSVSNAYHFGIDHTFARNDSDKFKIDLGVGFKDKEYNHNLSLSYERTSADIGLSYKHDDLWEIGWRNGLINYEYIKASQDQLKLFTQVSGWVKWFDGRLKIAPSYKFQYVDQLRGNGTRDENTARLASTYKLGLPYFDSLSGAYELGKTDTKDSEEEDRDDDLQFRFHRWYLASEHPLSSLATTAFKYGEIQRDYRANSNNYRTWFLENKTGFTLYEDVKNKTSLQVTTEHREGDYDIVDSLRYIKNTAIAKISCLQKKDWEFTPSLAVKKFDYHASPEKNELDYDSKFEFSKKLFNQNVDVNLSYRYTWKLYRYKSDMRLWMAKAAIGYTF
ncbi:MAG: hypothetical protein WCG78_06910 [Candidatus Omnitrophota bacterium]